LNYDILYEISKSCYKHGVCYVVLWVLIVLLWSLELDCSSTRLNNVLLDISPIIHISPIILFWLWG